VPFSEFPELIPTFRELPMAPYHYLELKEPKKTLFSRWDQTWPKISLRSVISFK